MLDIPLFVYKTYTISKGLRENINLKPSFKKAASYA